MRCYQSGVAAGAEALAWQVAGGLSECLTGNGGFNRRW